MTAGKLQITVTESLSELNKTFAKASKPVQRRVDMLIAVKKNQPLTLKQLCKKTGAQEATLVKWVNTYRQEGIKGLLKPQVRFKLSMSQKRIPVAESMLVLKVKARNVLPRNRLRLRMLMAIKKKPVISDAELAKAVKVNSQRVKKWYQLYKEGGLDKLLEFKLRGK